MDEIDLNTEEGRAELRRLAPHLAIAEEPKGGEPPGRSTGALVDKECVICGEPFRTYRCYEQRGPNHGICCSRKCAVAFRKSQLPPSVKMTRNCEKCGKPFEVFPSQAQGGHGRFCSRECCGTPRDFVNGPCATCGGIIFSRSPQQYCSQSCAARSPSNPRRKEKTVATCQGCGKEYEVGGGSKGVVCSLECWGKIKTRHTPGKPHPTGKGGRRDDLGGMYVRSRWEANWARYLNWLVSTGEILSWEYEPDTFEFHGIRRGTRFYTPDFKVTNKDGSVEYQEVKGWLTSEGKTRLKRMAKYHPDVKLVLVDKAFYRAVAKKVSAIIPGWERCPKHGA